MGMIEFCFQYFKFSEQDNGDTCVLFWDHYVENLCLFYQENKHSNQVEARPRKGSLFKYFLADFVCKWGGNLQTRQKSFTKNIARKGAEGGYPQVRQRIFRQKSKYLWSKTLFLDLLNLFLGLFDRSILRHLWHLFSNSYLKKAG